MKQNIILILIVVIAGVLIYGLFNNKSDSRYLDTIKAQDETIKAVQAERDTYRQWKDDEVREGQKKDSLLRLKYKSNTIVYEKIPVIVGNYSDDELRRAVEDFR